jgi:hypothetical protein
MAPATPLPLTAAGRTATIVIAAVTAVVTMMGTVELAARDPHAIVALVAPHPTRDMMAINLGEGTATDHSATTELRPDNRTPDEIAFRTVTVITTHGTAAAGVILNRLSIIPTVILRIPAIRGRHTETNYRYTLHLLQRKLRASHRSIARNSLVFPRRIRRRKLGSIFTPVLQPCTHSMPVKLLG